MSKGKGGDFMAIYIDGELKASRAKSDGPKIALTGLRIGGDGKQYYHRGCIESLRIWSVVRTPEEIKRGMGSDVIGDEDGLVSAFGFNQGLGDANNNWWDHTKTLVNRVPGRPNGELKNSARVGSASNWVASDVVQHGPMAPVYRFYNGAKRDHILTASPAERRALKQSGWLEEGVAFYAPRGPRPGTTPLYRLFNAGTNDHVYTTSAQERGTLDPRIDYGATPSAFVQEPIPCFVHRDPAVLQ